MNTVANEYTVSAIIAVLVLTMAATLLTCIPAANAMPYIKTVNGVEYTRQIKILRHSFGTGWSAREFATITDVYQGHYNQLYKAREIEAMRPEVITFVYYNTLLVWGPEYPPEYDSAKLQMFKNNKWLLRDTSGNYVMTKDGTAYYVDFANPAYHTWLAYWYKRYIDQYGLDGASLDNWFVDSSVWWYTSQEAINPRTRSYWTNQEICNAYKAMTLKIRQVVGSNKIILVNGVYNGNHFYLSGRNKYYIDGILNGGVDAVMSEGLLSTYDASAWYSEDLWLKGIKFAAWMEDNFPAKGGKYFMTITTDNSFWSGSNLPPDMTEQEYQKYVTYCYASRLLTVKRLTSIMNFGNYIKYAYLQSLFKINIGTPSESYHVVGSGHVYARKFTGGMVLVNPTSSSYTVTIGSGYRNAIKGNSEPSVLTVPAHTGVILQNE